MGKRIVICCDGTWSEPKDEIDKKTIPTNVLKLVRAVLPQDVRNDTYQIVFYDQGIGTGTIGYIDKYVGGGTGLGISKNITDCYRFLANNYSIGDEIFCFGFSRGAYTIRSLCGLINTIGLLAKKDLGLLALAYSYYRKKPGKRLNHEYNDLVKETKTTQPTVKFLGAWETVGSLGVPTPLLGALSRSLWVGFHDSSLSQTIENAYQALAIDERRRAFKPAVWTKKAGQNEIKQVWFTGVHRSIGGGYTDTGLSDIAFQWLCECAQKNGLALNAEYLAEKSKPNPYAEIEDNYTLGYQFLDKLRASPSLRKIGSEECIGEMIHESVMKRIQQESLNYAPKNLFSSSPTLTAISTESPMPEYISINGKILPILKSSEGDYSNPNSDGCKRNTPRISANDEIASIIHNGETTNVCQVIDFSEGGGAKLRLAETLKPGVEIQLESPSLGKHNVIVIWISDDIAGVQFAA